MMDDSSDSGSQEDVGLPPLPEVLEDTSRMFGWDASTAKLRNLILVECALNVFRALRGEIGLNRTLEAIRPYNLNMGMALAGYGPDYVKKRFGLPYNQAMEVAMPMYWFHCGASDGHCKSMEIRDGMAVVEVYSCPFALANAPPEACLAISHYTLEGVCEGINPEFEYVWTHHLPNNDGRCRYVVKKKSVKTDLSELGKLERTYPMIKMSQQERDLLSLLVAWAEVNVFLAASVDAIGSERTIELIAPLARRTGMELGAKLMGETEGINDPLMIKDKLDFLNVVLTQRGDSATVTSSGIEKEIISCPFTNGTREICDYMEELFEGVCEAIAPAYEFAYDRMMSKGDKTCHWVVRKKESSKTIKAKEEVSSEDPARLLALRFAKGEVSLEEFEKNIASLRKLGLIR
jgi:predicted ArsR family transcriptional regulator